MVGAYGIAFASADLGLTWRSLMSRLPNPEGLHIYAVRRQGQTLLMAGERGLLLRSTDGGASYVSLESPFEGSLFTAELLSESDIVVAGLKGSLLRSRDGGQAWTAIDAGESASFTASSLGSDGTLYLASQSGQLRAWPRAGALHPVNRQPLPALNGVLRTNHDQVILLSDRGVSTLQLPAQGEVSLK
ncbi:Ycf48-like protein [compost metagenome]